VPCKWPVGPSSCPTVRPQSSFLQLTGTHHPCSCPLMRHRLCVLMNEVERYVLACLILVWQSILHPANRIRVSYFLLSLKTVASTFFFLFYSNQGLTFQVAMSASTPPPFFCLFLTFATNQVVISTNLPPSLLLLLQSSGNVC
jgi:hypothetical protein